MSKIFGLIGHPVKHSLSAAMHNAAFRAIGLDAKYLLFDKLPEELLDFFAEIKKQGSEIHGLNVTIPHKVTVHDFLQDSLSDNAKKIGAVNTVIIKEDNNSRRLIGENTDAAGFLESLSKDLRFDPKEKIIFVLGAGGASRAIIMALADMPEKIYFMDIDDEKALKLEADYKKYFNPRKINRINEKDKTDCIKVSDLFVNATAIGMKSEDGLPLEEESLHKNMFIFDLVYNPKETKLLRLAREKEIDCVNGMGMLLYQGALSFKLWTGLEPPIEAMRRAVSEAI